VNLFRLNEILRVTIGMVARVLTLVSLDIIGIQTVVGFSKRLAQCIELLLVTVSSDSRHIFEWIVFLLQYGWCLVVALLADWVCGVYDLVVSRAWVFILLVRLGTWFVMPIDTFLFRLVLC
jgi:hypothetical protein